jgi:DNA-3-methyladenine glycosylase I
MSEAVAGLRRCDWGDSTPDYASYHDTEWGVPLRGDNALFERLSLEAFQSGLSWLTILRKRQNFRAAFAGFDIARVAAFDERDRQRLLADAGIVRNRAKVDAAMTNARAILDNVAEGLTELLPAGGAQRHPGGIAGVEGDGQGTQAARIRLRRPDHRVRADAGYRHGR